MEIQNIEVVQLTVDIVRWVDDYQPGIVECQLVDAFGHEWFFVDKLPYFTSTRLDVDSHYPEPGTIDCQVIATQKEESGREMVTINTAQPWDIEATNGETLFIVWSEQLIESS